MKTALIGAGYVPAHKPFSDKHRAIELVHQTDIMMGRGLIRSPTELAIQAPEIKTFPLEFEEEQEKVGARKPLSVCQKKRRNKTTKSQKASRRRNR